MIEVYYYIEVEEVDKAVECGLKLSKWFDKEVQIEGDNKKCLSTLLNPKDDIDSYKSSMMKCLKIELPPKYCFVADKYLYEVGLQSPDVMEMYTKSIIPAEKYIFGSYRLPECLVTSTVIAGQVGVLDMRLDSPVLFGNSEELYINNIIETYKEEHDDFNDAMLYSFYCRLTENQRVMKTEDKEKGIAVFFDKESRKTYTIKVPDISKY